MSLFHEGVKPLERADAAFAERPVRAPHPRIGDSNMAAVNDQDVGCDRATYGNNWEPLDGDTSCQIHLCTVHATAPEEEQFQIKRGLPLARYRFLISVVFERPW